MKSIHQNIFLLLSCLLVSFNGLQAQQTIEAEMLKNGSTDHNCLFNPSYVAGGTMYHNKIELQELASGQSGYMEFSFTDFDNSDIFIGLQNQSNTSQQWRFQFLNGEYLINGTNYGTCVSGNVYKVERCDASIRYYVDDALITENPLSDINFVAEAIVEVIQGDYVGANKPRLSLQFPFLNNCTSTPPTTNGHFYADLKKQLDGSFVRILTPTLRFKYMEDYALVPGQNETLEYKIYKWDDRITPINSGSLTKKRGENEMTITMTGLSYYQYYILETEDSKGQEYLLRFYYHCPIEVNCPQDQ